MSIRDSLAEMRLRHLWLTSRPIGIGAHKVGCLSPLHYSASGAKAQPPTYEAARRLPHVRVHPRLLVRPLARRVPGQCGDGRQQRQSHIAQQDETEAHHSRIEEEAEDPSPGDQATKAARLHGQRRAGTHKPWQCAEARSDPWP